MSDRGANWVLEDNDEGEKGFLPHLSSLYEEDQLSFSCWRAALTTGLWGTFFHELDSHKSNKKMKPLWRDLVEKSQIQLLSTQKGFQVRPIRMQVMKKERGVENRKSGFLHLTLAPRQPKGSTMCPITHREKKARGRERKETKRGREGGWFDWRRGY